MKRTVNKTIKKIRFFIATCIVISSTVLAFMDDTLSTDVIHAFSGSNETLEISAPRIDYTTNTVSFLDKTYTLIEVDGGDQSGRREADVAVDIGFGDRLYWAFTNDYGQLVYVYAPKIELQDDKTEPVLKSGRYYPDEARVPGTERSDLDQGHVIM